MTKNEVAFIRAKVDMFAQWENEEISAACRCQDADEAEEHYLEAIKCGSAHNALWNILIEMGY